MALLTNSTSIHLFQIIFKMNQFKLIIFNLIEFVDLFNYFNHPIVSVRFQELKSCSSNRNLPYFNQIAFKGGVKFCSLFQQ